MLYIFSIRSIILIKDYILYTTHYLTSEIIFIHFSKKNYGMIIFDFEFTENLYLSIISNLIKKNIIVDLTRQIILYIKI